MSKTRLTNILRRYFYGLAAVLLMSWQLALPAHAAAWTSQECDDWAKTHDFNSQNWPSDCKGSLKVNKKVDADGNGVYEGSNNTANTLGFKWGYDNNSPARDMGTTASSILTGTHTVTENTVSGYKFVGWYYTGNEDQSCSNPAGTTLPASVSVKKNQTTEITLCNQAVKGSITIIKDAQPNDGQDFGFTTTGQGLSSFSLDDDNNQTLSNTKKFSDLSAGTYTVTEQSNSGWDLKSINCGDTSTTVYNNKVTINLAAGQNVTCTFTNLKHGCIVVHKVTDPKGDPSVFSTTISGTSPVNNPTQNISDGQSVVYEVSQGTYGVSEDLPDGWVQSDTTCYHLVINQENMSASCTIYNTKLAKLTIVKDAKPNSDQKFNFDSIAFDTSFSLVDNGYSPTNVKQFTDLYPGTYDITEQATDGWDLSSIQCWGNNDWWNPQPTVYVRLKAGEDVTCKFTNKKRSNITGHKFNDLNNNGKWDAGEPALADWTINLYSCHKGEEVNLESLRTFSSLQQLQQCSESPVDITQTDANGAYSFGNLLPGDYEVCEVNQNGWTQTFPTDNKGCHLIKICQPGQEETADFGNFKDGEVSGFKWNDVNGNAKFDEGEQKLSGWTITLYASDGDDGWTQSAVTQTDASGNYSFGNLVAGDYRVCETQQAGWSRTFPTGSDCQDFTVAQSGQETEADFGNKQNPQGHVLGTATTKIVNTGANSMPSIFVGLLIIGLLGTVSRATLGRKFN